MEGRGHSRAPFPQRRTYVVLGYHRHSIRAGPDCRRGRAVRAQGPGFQGFFVRRRTSRASAGVRLHSGEPGQQPGDHRHRAAGVSLRPGGLVVHIGVRDRLPGPGRRLCAPPAAKRLHHGASDYFKGIRRFCRGAGVRSLLHWDLYQRLVPGGGLFRAFDGAVSWLVPAGRRRRFHRRHVRLRYFSAAPGGRAWAAL